MECKCITYSKADQTSDCNLLEAHCFGIGRGRAIVEQSRSS